MKVIRRRDRTTVAIHRRNAVLAFVFLTMIWPFFSAAWPALLWIHATWLLLGLLVLSLETRIQIDDSPTIRVESCVLGLAYARSNWSRTAQVYGLAGGWGDEPLLAIQEDQRVLEMVVDDRDHAAICEEVARALMRHRPHALYR